MWTHKAWAGRFLPQPPPPASERLRAYAGWCTAVEGNPTFYAVPARDTVPPPDNVEAPALARRFHDEVRARVPELEPLPEPEPVGPLTLF